MIYYLVCTLKMTINNNYKLIYKRLLRKYKFVPNYRIIHHMRSDNLEHYKSNEWRLRPTDLIASTDSSWKDGLAGIGIMIKDYNVIHCFHQPIGNVSNNFGELFAINQVRNILKFLKTNTKNRRLILFTDSLYNFIPLITTPNKKLKLQYSNLLNNTQTYLLKSKFILWKVKFHTDPPQSFNNIADLLADEGRMNEVNSLYVIPNINSIKYMKYTKYILLDSNVRTFESLAANFSVAASMEFCLQPD